MGEPRKGRMLFAAIALACCVLAGSPPAAGPDGVFGDEGGEDPYLSLQSSDPARRDLVVIDSTLMDALIAADLHVVWKGASFFLAEWDRDERRRAATAGIDYLVILPGVTPANAIFLLEVDDDTEPGEDWQGRVLYRLGRKWVVELESELSTDWTDHGHFGVHVPRVPRGWEAPGLRLVPYGCGYDPLIADLLSRTSQTEWMEWIEDLSGVEPVTIGGTQTTITTRNSATMFSGAAGARGYDYVKQQAEFWKYPPAQIEEDPFVWSIYNLKNLVLTLPGTVSPSEVVLLTAHLDSTSQSASTLAPGANDNGTGTATLLEVARLMRQFRFERTVKIIFFTGEEQGLRGSAAYVVDHSMSGYLGVLNLDMFGWDSNGDRCFEIHAGTQSSSIDVGNCFRDSVASYGLGLSHDFLTTTATDRSDHASFWSVNVGAIEIAENFFNDGQPGGCVGIDNNPYYHNTNDRIGLNMTPSYAFDIARAAMATISAMARPVEACFTQAPGLDASPGVNAVDLDWSPVAGAASYRVWRSIEGCDGQWFQVAATSGTSLVDSGVTLPQVYSYFVEAVDADGFCVSAMSNCDQAVPQLYAGSATASALVDSCPGGGAGSADGALDPGETITLPISLLNTGNTTLTSVTGTLTSLTPGVTVLDASATWPDVAPASSALTQPDHFRIRLDSGLVCGTAVELQLAVNHAQGAIISSIVLDTGQDGTDVLLSEPFSAGIPAGWTVVNGGTGGGAAATWTTANPGNRTIGAPFSAPFAIVDSDNAGSGSTQDEQLITPLLDATGCQELTLQFSNQFRYYSQGQAERADVDLSLNGGANWTNLLRMQGADDGYTTPNTKTIDLTSAVSANPSNVKLRFRYTGAFEWWWAIDNVTVSCERASCTTCLSDPGSPGEPSLLRLGRSGGDLQFTWTDPTAGCEVANFALYRGDLDALHLSGFNHDVALTCLAPSSNASIAESDPRLGTNDYFLVVAGNGQDEGSYGRDSVGSERPPSLAACSALQDLGSCGAP